MNIPLTITHCQTCAGFGVVAQGEGLGTCPVCNGVGTTATMGSTQLSYHIPELVTPHSPSLDKLHQAVRTLLFIAFFSATLLSGFFILLQSSNLEELLWHHDLPHAIFGISGLASMWGLSHWNARHTSEKDLSELKEQIQKGQSIEISEYLNSRVGELLNLAAFRAKELHSTMVDDGILLLTLLEQPRIQMIIKRLEIAPNTLYEDVVRTLPPATAGNVQTVSYQPIVRERIYQAVHEALERDLPYVDLEDILLAYALDQKQFQSLFSRYRITEQSVYSAARWFAGDQERARQWAFWRERGRSRPSGFMNRAWTALPTPTLDHYSEDITVLAGQGGLPSASMRATELTQILEVLASSAQQHNVVLIGDPGVGKNTLISALAVRMLEENVPENLKDRRLVELDLASLYKGSEDGQATMQKILQEVGQAGNVILAIPELQQIAAASKESLDGSAILANALEKHAIQIITTASTSDFHRYVEGNSTLATLLTPIQIAQLTTEQAIDVLEEEAGRIEHAHSVLLSYPALEAAARLAERYINDLPLPSSAIAVLEQAAAQTKASGERWVTKDRVEESVERRVGSPVKSANDQQANQLLNLEEVLHRRIVGQDVAVSALAQAIRRARTGLHDANRPLSFLFVGPTGVGKTETAKALADTYFGSASQIIRFDMSEYQDPQSINRLIGAPAATSDSYTEGGLLSQPLRDHPYSLVLLDEFEKANPQVLNLFLQILDDGRLTENSGRVVKANQALFIATSNAGSSEIVQLIQQGATGDDLAQKTTGLLLNYFKPELLNRFDSIVPFHPLQGEQLLEITRRLLQGVIEKAKAQDITLTFSDDAIKKVAQKGYDPIYGARPLRRAIQGSVEDLLAKLILEKQVQPGSTLQITAEMIQ